MLTDCLITKAVLIREATVKRRRTPTGTANPYKNAFLPRNQQFVGFKSLTSCKFPFCRDCRNMESRRTSTGEHHPKMLNCQKEDRIPVSIGGSKFMLSRKVLKQKIFKKKRTINNKPSQSELYFIIFFYFYYYC